MNKQMLLLTLFAITVNLTALRAEEKNWTDRVKVSGDFRYRHEFIGQDAYNKDAAQKVRGYDRNRQRIRLRLGLQFQVNDMTDVNTRFGTSTFISGGGDPISTNQDLSGGFSAKPFWLDRAYLDFHPGKSFSARAGRQPVPFEYTELLWDADLNVEGIAALFSRKTEKTEVYLRAGGFWAGERGPSSYKKHALNQGLFEGQIGGKVKIHKTSVNLAVAYIDFGNVKSSPTLFAASNGYGNTLTHITRDPAREAADSLGYLYDYNLININGSVKLNGERIEPMLVFDYVTNTGAEKNEAYDKKLCTSWLAGIQLKFSKLPTDWEVAYNYRDQQKDALIGAFTDSDPAGGGTNYNGHKLSAGAPVMKNVKLALTYYRNVKDPYHKDEERKLGYDRIAADVEVKF
ncbi:hypothetical protein EHM69_02120 [candidate division KSB1 bacterium]|nr:MAG: hypothetical protein EHM69_02120 [candidate division KSB1 bacterium]